VLAAVFALVNASWCVLTTLYGIRRLPGLQLPSLALSMVFLVVGILALICAAAGWRSYRWRAFAPLASCLLVVVVYRHVGYIGHRLLFELSTPSWEGAIRRMAAGAIAVPAELSRIREVESTCLWTYGVWARKDADGTLLVEFPIERGFPAMHSGYIYCSSCATEEDLKKKTRWPLVGRVKARSEHWFEFSS